MPTASGSRPALPRAVPMLLTSTAVSEFSGPPLDSMRRSARSSRGSTDSGFCRKESRAVASVLSAETSPGCPIPSERSRRSSACAARCSASANSFVPPALRRAPGALRWLNPLPSPCQRGGPGALCTNWSGHNTTWREVPPGGASPAPAAAAPHPIPSTGGLWPRSDGGGLLALDRARGGA